MPTSVPPPSGINRKRRLAAKRTDKQHHDRRRRQQGKRSQLQQPTSSRLPFFRLLMVWGVLVGASVGMAVNLYRLQIVEASFLQKEARKQQLFDWQSAFPRRPVVDRNQSVLAMDRLVYEVYARPAKFDKSASNEAIAAQLAPILNRSHSDVLKQLNSGKSYIRLAAAIPEEIINQIRILELDGIELVPHYSRLYPQHDLVADVVGYVNADRQGQAGVEYSLEQLLARPLKKTQLRRTAKGSIISYSVPQGFAHVDDLRLQLTLDIRLQRRAQSILRQQLQKFNAKRGSVIVMDARNGAILALVDEPSYDPNAYSKSNVELFRNWALSDLYEPGSTFKPLNVAIALETGAIAPNQVFPDPEVIKVAGWPIRNADPEPYTQLSIAGILQHSSNVGMVQIMQRVPPADYYNWLKRLGLGQTIHIDLPFEAKSQIRSQKQFVTYSIEPATASFGQGFSLTPIHLVQLHGALANGGKLITPHVVSGLFDAQGKPQWQPTLPAPRQIFSPQTAQTVLEMMETVVTQGSGKAVIIPGYRIAGKTGTAQKASAKGGYDSKAKITSFVGIFPVESPRYVVLAVIDEPKKGQIIRGSTTAAPVVKSVIGAIISLERLLPSQPQLKQGEQGNRGSF